MKNKNKKFLFTPPNVESGTEVESKLTDFKRGRKIGSGAFGSVYEVTHIKTKKIFAMKEMSKRFIEEHDMLENVVLEAKVMYSLNHPNIVRIITHFEDQRNIYLILEKVENGSIDDLLKKRRKLSIRVAVEILYQLVTAIEFLHSMPHPVIHRDLKPANVLLTKDNMVKIADFGWASVMQNKSQTVTVAGTYQYLAPEIIEQKGYSTPVDVWMLGIIFYEMIAGKTPFEPRKLGPRDDFLTPLIKNIRSKKPEFTSDFNTQSKKLLVKLLEKKPKKRIKINEIKRDNLFKKYDLKKFDDFAKTEIPKDFLNKKTNKEWYVSIRQVRADLLMSMTTQKENKGSVYKGMGYKFGQRFGTMRRQQKPEVVNETNTVQEKNFAKPK
jgi:serine/threonine protein kinase